MSKGEFKLMSHGLGSASTINIDGVLLGPLVKSVTIRQSGGVQPSVMLELVLHSLDVTTDGAININATPVTDKIGRAIYEALRSRYEGARP